MKHAAVEYDRLLAELQADANDLRTVHDLNMQAQRRIQEGARDQLA